MITAQLFNPSDWNKYKSEIMAIENQFDESLQFEEEDVKEMVCGEGCITVLLMEDGHVIGDCYANRIENCGGDYFEEDGKNYYEAEEYNRFGHSNIVYVASTAILEKYQGRGMIKPLRDFFEDHLRNIGIKYVIGHTQGKMLDIVKKKGADVIETFEDWYGCGEVHYLYELNLWKQDKDYNCGVYALCFFLHSNGIKSRLTEIERMLNPTDADGTSHESITKVLKELGIYNNQFLDSSIGQLKEKLPALVNYQYDGDGHYGVVKGMSWNRFIIYNPCTGEEEFGQTSEFDKSWYSERYGSHWFLTIR